MEHRLRILHLEDSKEDVELIQELLSAAGLDCEIEVVDTGKDFEASLESKEFDVILSDYSLPSFDGLTALEIAKKRVPDIPFVFVTGTMGEDIAIESLKKGATDYVLKTKLSRLAPAVKRAIEEAAERRKNKLAEEGLIKAKEEWERTFDAIEDLLMILDTHYRIVKANKAMAEKLGVTPIEAEGLTCYDHVHGTTGPPAFCPHSLMLADGKSHSVEIYEEYLGGYYNVSVAPLYGPDGKLYGSVHIIRDITARKQAEEELLRWAHVFEYAEWGVVVGSADGKTLELLNPAFARMHGYEVAELVGRPIVEVFAPESRVELAGHIALACQKGHHIFEATHRRKDGREFPVLMDVTAVKDETGGVRYLVVNVQDITERKQLGMQLRQAQKMEAIGTLTGGIAHDFNNILAAIIGFSEMVFEKLPEGSQLRDDQAQVLKAGNRAKELVKQILTFSRQSEQKHQAVMIHLIAKEALKLLRASIPTTIEIRENIDPTCGLVLADPSQIHQILMNLCTNAYHAMREKGGILTVNLAARRLEAGDLPVGLELAPGDYVRLEVSDTGCGMTPAVKEKIFDPYFTTKNKGEGTGLGLSVVHGIVKSCGGQILVASAPDCGTTFEVYLPRTKAEAVEIDTVANRDLPGGRERLLVVDDELVIVQMEQMMLESLGYQVTALNSSVDTLKLFLTNPAAFDLLLTDMTMPDMTGVELAEKILAVRPEMPIILCTGYSSMIDPQKAHTLGVKEYLTKPLTKKDLAIAVRSVLDGIPAQAVEE